MSPHGFVYQVDIVKREAPGRPPVNLPQVAWKAYSSYWGVGGPLQGSVCVRPVAAVLRGRHSRNNLNGYVSKTSYIDENAWFASPALAITDVRHEISLVWAVTSVDGRHQALLKWGSTACFVHQTNVVVETNSVTPGFGAT